MLLIQVRPMQWRVPAFKIGLCHFNARKTASLQSRRQAGNKFYRPPAVDNFQPHATVGVGSEVRYRWQASNCKQNHRAINLFN